MSVIGEFSIPASDFVLGRALQQTSDLSVELEQMIPTSKAPVPYFWVIGEEREEFDSVLEQEPELATFEIVDELEDRRLYRVEWDSSVDTFVQTIVAHDVVLQDARGDANSWRFQMRFQDSHDLSDFHTACQETEIDLTVESLYNPIQPNTTTGRNMTKAQRDLVERAYDEGYFDVPRKITLAELADDLGISDQAVNERLRRGLNALIGSTLKFDSSSQEK